MAGNDDTIQVEFYAPWPNFGVKLSQQWGAIRTDTSHLAPLVRGVGLDASGDFTTLDGVEKASVQAWEVGEQDFHNRFRTHYNKDDDLFEIQSNVLPGTSEAPNWYTTWAVASDGQITQQTSGTVGENVGTGAGVFKDKSGQTLRFRSIVVSSPLSITQNDDELALTSSAEITTYSSLGGTAIIGTKNVADLPFKGITAGSNMSLSDDGTQLTLSSTSMIVEFYGISVGHDDGSVNYPEVHNFLVNRDQFYVTQQKSHPSSKTIILNSIGDVFDAGVLTGFVLTAGDTMTGALLHPDGTAANPAVSFSGETNSGLTRLASNDIALVSGGTSVLRALSDRVYLPTRTQIKSSGLVGTPDLMFFANTTTGIYQTAVDNDSFAFATAGVAAGHFDSSQNFHTTAQILAPIGDTTTGGSYVPSYSFEGDPNTGIARWNDPTVNRLAFIVDGDWAGFFDADTSFRFRLQTVAQEAHNVALPSYSFVSDNNTGMYSPVDGQVGFSADGSLAGYFDASLNLHVTNRVYAGAGTSSLPSHTFEGDTATGMYLKNTSQLAFVTFGTEQGYFSKWGDFLVQRAYRNLSRGSVGAPVITGPTPSGGDETGIWWPNVNQMAVSSNQTLCATFEGSGITVPGQYKAGSGSTGAASYGFTGDLNTGMYRIRDTDIGFICNGSLRLSIENDKTLVAGQLRVGFGTEGAPHYGFSSDTNTGMYRKAADELGFSTLGKLAGYFNNAQSLVVTENIYAGAGVVATPALSFRYDSNTGIYQNSATGNDGSIAFSSQGTRAGYFDASLDLYVTNRVYAGNGTEALPGLSFASDPNTGLYRNAEDWLGIVTGGSWQILISQIGDIIIQQKIRTTDLNHTVATPPYTFSGDESTGMYSPVDGEVGFTTVGVKAAWADASQNWRVAANVFVADDPYAAGWDGNLEVPTKNAVYDKIETLGGGGDEFDNITVLDTASIGRTESGPAIFYAGDHFNNAITAHGDVAIQGNITQQEETGAADRYQIFGGSNHFAFPAFAFTGDPNTGIAKAGVADSAYFISGANISGEWGGGSPSGTGYWRCYSRLLMPKLNSIAKLDMSWYNDDDTGYWLSGVNQFSFVTGGTAAGTFDRNQNLHVTGTLYGEDSSTLDMGDFRAGTGTFYTAVTVPDEVYGGDWDTSLEVPTKNAVFDKIEALGVGSGIITMAETESGGWSGTPAQFNVDSKYFYVSSSSGDGFPIISQVDPPYIHLFKTDDDDQDLGAGTTTINWDAEGHKGIGFTHSNTVNPSRIQVDVTGRYLVKAHISANNEGAGELTIIARLQVDGAANYKPSYARDTSTGAGASLYLIMLMDVEIELTAGQYVEINTWIEHDDATYTATTNTSWMDFIMRKIS
jgi:hypothetical protein